MKIALATKNAGKIAEFRNLADSVGWLELVGAPEHFNCEETGDSFTANALIKARTLAQLMHLPTLAEDSGLVVEALNGRPGIYSARYAAGSDQDRLCKLLDEMANVADPKRDAAYVCSMVLCDAQGRQLHTSLRFWEGYIGHQERGSNGFGYDPIFYLKGQNRTAAQLSLEEKNQVSHRGRAWQDMFAYLCRTFGK